VAACVYACADGLSLNTGQCDGSSSGFACLIVVPFATLHVRTHAYVAELYTCTLYLNCEGVALLSSTAIFGVALCVRVP
jgi:hypothetical protein